MATEIKDDPVHAAIPERSTDATSLDRSEDNSTQSLFRAAIGTSQTDYYSAHFARFDAADRAGISWNWAAALMTLNWMAFRQLWGAALTYAGIVVTTVLLLFGIGRLVFQLSTELETGLLLVLLFLSVVLPGMYGNALLYTQSRKRMERALASNTTLPEACAMLSRQASQRQRLIWLALANLTLAAAVGAATLALPEFDALPLHTEKMTLARERNASAPALPSTGASASGAVSAPASTASMPTPAASASASAQPGQGSRGVRGKIQNSLLPVLPPLITPPAEVPYSAASAASAAKARPGQGATPVTRTAEKSAPSAKPIKAGKGSKGSEKPASASAHEVAFMINVGLFAKDNNALNAFTKLKDANLPALSQVLKTPKGKRTRVRVGPFPTQTEADAAAEKIHALQLDAVVFQQ